MSWTRADRPLGKNEGKEANMILAENPKRMCHDKSLGPTGWICSKKVKK